MLNSLTRLAQATEDVLQQLDGITYETLTNFLDLRESLIEELRHVTMSDEERSKGKELVGQVLSSDPIIQEKMIQLQNEAQQELTKLNAAKKKRSAYESGYSGESLFFDSKK